MSFQKILLVQTAYLGDVILTTPLIRAIKQVFPDSQLDVLVIPQTAGALANNPHIDQTILFDKRGQKRTAFKNVLQILKARRHELAFSPHSSLTTGLLIRLAGIPTRVGFNRNPIRFFLTHKAPVPSDGLTIEKYLKLLSFFSDQPFSIQTQLFPSEEDREKADCLWRQVDAQRPTIALAPGSVWPTKRWPAEYYAQLVALLKKRFNLIFIGSGDERELCQQIIDQAKAQQALNLAGRLSILQSAAVIEKCDLMICNDSGAMHIANAVQTDVFAFFGPTVRRFGFFPFRDEDWVFEVPDLYCRPCGKHGHHECPEDHFRCMLEIKPQTVWQKVKEKFKVSA
ncbi:lipopolysaccharide heptosyltransferase II [Calditrichota bacterium LG25]